MASDHCSSLLCQSVYGSIQALRSWAVSHVLRGDGMKAGRQTKGTWPFSPTSSSSSSKNKALWPVLGAKPFSEVQPKQRKTRVRLGTIGGRRRKRKKGKEIRRKSSIDGDIEMGRTMRMRKGTKALDMTSYNLPNFVEEKIRDTAKSCDSSMFGTYRSAGVAMKHSKLLRSYRFPLYYEK